MFLPFAHARRAGSWSATFGNHHGKDIKMTVLADILARWDSGEGRPYQGRLINMDQYNGDGAEPPTDLGCMCAQGQVLHLLGGWDPKRLASTEQVKADEATAKLLNISVGHAILLRNVNDSIDGSPSIVLTNPEKVLGDQAQTVLAFWLHMDNMTDAQLAAASAAARDAAWAAARDAAWAAASAAARDAAMAAAWAAARDAAMAAAWAAARDAASASARAAAGYACGEIQGALILREQGKPFYFLPMFGLENPEAIPPLPLGYGQPTEAQ
jgi:hypothetical protein